MLVYQCLLFGKMPEAAISDDVVRFVEESVRNNVTFKLKSVKEGVNPSRVTTGVIGFHPNYGMPYMSNPDKKQGLAAVDVYGKRIVFEPAGTPFFDQRDAVVYCQPEDTYVRGSCKEVLAAFADKGYRFFMFRPKNVSDGLIRYESPADLPVGAKLALEAML